MTSTGLEIKLLDGRIISAVVLIKASELSLDDDFMKYEPKTTQELIFKKVLVEAISKGINDFYRFICDPSFSDDLYDFCYKFGQNPAIDKSYNWWVMATKRSELDCRLGTRYEYAVFLGILIKKLIQNGFTLEDAWYSVCTNSYGLGVYGTSEPDPDLYVKILEILMRTYSENNELNNTGSMETLGFYDLGNTRKILAEDEKEGGFWVAGGDYNDSSSDCPLANMRHINGRYGCVPYGVGWLVLDCDL